MKPPRTHTLFAAAVLALCGCSDNGVAPVRHTPEDTGLHALPLAVGNAWDYALTFDLAFLDQGGGDVLPSEHRTGTGTREIAGVDTLGGREYLLEVFTAKTDGGSERTQWRRYRQEADSLLQADVSPAIPPGVIPGDVETGEMLRLHFPVTPGDSWELRAGDPAITLIVESLDTLSLDGGETPAFRVRIDDTSAGPDDYTRMWYGAVGLVRREIHAEFDAFDAGTSQFVHIVKHEVESLVSARIAAARAAQ